MLGKKNPLKPQGTWPSQRNKELQLLECCIVFSLLHTMFDIFVISHVEMSLEVTVGFNGAFL